MKRPLGIVSGYVLKLARESAGLTQQQLADALDVTRAGVQSWESSRRPLGAMSVQQMLALRSRLIRYGASPVLVSIGSAAPIGDRL
jgi:transcriptional regulator with XRE-family HTH domain